MYTILFIGRSEATFQSITQQLQPIYPQVLHCVSRLDAVIQLRQKEGIGLVIIESGAGADTLKLAEMITEQYQLPFILLTATYDKALLSEMRHLQPLACLTLPLKQAELLMIIELSLPSSVHQPAGHKRTHRQHTDSLYHIANQLFLRQKEQFKRVEINDIYLLEADSNYTYIHTRDEKFTYAALLRQMEQKLDNPSFMRVHRSYIINLNAVQGFEGNSLFVGNMVVPVSKKYRHEIFNIFHIL